MYVRNALQFVIVYCQDKLYVKTYSIFLYVDSIMVFGIKSSHVKMGAFAVIILVIVVFAFNKFRSKRSNFQWPVPAGSTTVPAEVTADTNFNNTLNACQDTYNQSLIAAGTNVTAQTAAETVRSACIKRASTDYVTARCPVSTGTVPTDPTLRALYDAYQVNITSIQQAYVPAQRQIAATDVNYLNAARKGDMAGATRKYIASACPAFYKPTLATDPDLTATYSAWSVGDTVANGFRPVAVTVAAITAWADYAAVQFGVAEYFKSAATAANATIGPIKLTTVTGLVVGDQVQVAYKTATTVTAGVESAPVDGLANGSIATIVTTTNPPTVTITLPAAVTSAFVLPVDSVITKALKGGNANSKWKFAGTTKTPNWRLARDNGPGTFPQPVWATV